MKKLLQFALFFNVICMWTQAWAASPFSPEEWDYLFTHSVNGLSIPYHSKLKKELINKLEKNKNFVQVFRDEIDRDKSRYSLFKAIPDPSQDDYDKGVAEEKLYKMKKRISEAGEILFEDLTRDVNQVEYLELSEIQKGELQRVFAKYYFISKAQADGDWILRKQKTPKIPKRVKDKLTRFVNDVFNNKPDQFFDFLHLPFPPNQPSHALTGNPYHFEEWIIENFITWKKMNSYLYDLTNEKRTELFNRFSRTLEETYLVYLLPHVDPNPSDWFHYLKREEDEYFNSPPKLKNKMMLNGKEYHFHEIKNLANWFDLKPALWHLISHFKALSQEKQKAFIAGMESLRPSVKLFFKNLALGYSYEDAIDLAHYYHQFKKDFLETHDLKAIFENELFLSLSHFMAYCTKNWTELSYQNPEKDLGIFFKNELEMRLKELEKLKYGDESEEGESENKAALESNPFIGITAYHQYVKLYPKEALEYDATFYEYEFFPMFFQLSPFYFDSVFQSNLMNESRAQFWEQHEATDNLKGTLPAEIKEFEHATIETELERVFRAQPKLKKMFLEFALFQTHNPINREFQRKLVLKYAIENSPLQDLVWLEDAVLKPVKSNVKIKDANMITSVNFELAELNDVKEHFDSNVEFERRSKRFFKWLLQNPHEFVYHFGNNSWLQGLLLHVPLASLELNENEKKSFHDIVSLILESEDYLWNQIQVMSDFEIDKIHTFIKLHLKLIQLQMMEKPFKESELEVLREFHETLILNSDLEEKEHLFLMETAKQTFSTWRDHSKTHENKFEFIELRQSCTNALHEKLFQLPPSKN